MDEIKNIINEIMEDIKKRRENIKEIPGIPFRCTSCNEGEFLIQELPFICEFFGEFNCPIFREEIKDDIGKIFLNTSIDKVEDKAREILSSYLTNIRKMVRGGKGLNILGTIGVGKTSIIVLIIQKIFKERYSSFINYVVDLRYRFMLPTIITSNLSERELRIRYPRAMDRLFSRNIKINLEGTSRRSKTKNDF